MKRLGLAAALLLCGCADVVTPPKPPRPAAPPRDLPQIPRSFALEQTTRRKFDRLKVRVYDTGPLETRGSNVSSMKSWSSRTTLHALAFAVRHPVQGAILFGTGLPAGREPLKTAPLAFEPGLARDAARQLEQDGTRPESVRWIVLPDLRPEHTGRLDAFANATVVVDSREWRAQRERFLAGGGGLDTETFAKTAKLRLVDLSTAPAYGAFDHAEDLFGDGTVYLADLSGATPGSLGLWASLDEGPVLLTGDASWILDNHQDLALPMRSAIADVDRYWRRLYEMRAMQEAVPRLLILPAHDLTPLALQPRSDVGLFRPR